MNDLISSALDVYLAVVRDPAFRLAGWPVLGLIALRFPAIARPLAWTFAGTWVLQLLGVADLGSLRELGLIVLVAALVFALGPLVVVLDRFTRAWTQALAPRRRPSLMYVYAGASGVVAFALSLGAIWWAHEISPGLAGDVEIAIAGAMIASSVALIRVDRATADRVVGDSQNLAAS